jgi:hypothetical protein
MTTPSDVHESRIDLAMSLLAPAWDRSDYLTVRLDVGVRCGHAETREAERRLHALASESRGIDPYGRE